MDKIKRFFIIVGAMRSGKSHYINKLLSNKRTLVYNVGSTASDFPNFTETKSPNTKILQQKIYREFDRQKELKIYNDMYNLKGNIVIDDCRPLFRQGVPKELLYLVSKINHAGGGKGVNLFMIFHSFEQINIDFLTYVTDFLIFKSETISVNFRADLGQKITAKLEKAVNLLTDAPPYSYVHINLKK